MKSKKLLLIYLIIFYLEFIYHIFIFKNFHFKHLFFIGLFTFFTSIFIDLITSLFSQKKNNILFIISICFITLVFLIQFVNYQFYGNVVSIYSIFNGGQVVEFFDQIIQVIISNIFPIILLLIPVIYVILYRNLNFIEKQDPKYLKYQIGGLVLVYLGTILSLNFDAQAIYSAKNIYYEKHAPLQTSQILGLMTTMRIDVKRVITNFEESVIVVAKENDPEIIIEEEKIPMYNITQIDFDKLIENEKNKTIVNMHNYFKNEKATEKNDYTGMFKDKNLIYILAEAFSPLAVDPVLTPTLYKLVNSGFKFNNFYTPVYFVSTSDGEYVTLTSMLPKESVWSMARSNKISLPYAYGNVFKNLDYKTSAYHNGRYRFYDRHLSHPNMGYDYMGCGNGLQKLMNCNIWPQSDLEMINGTFELYSNEERFMTYYLTISGHLEYNFHGNNMAYKNKHLVDHLEYSNAVKAYLATHIELDKAIESLINKLDEKGILDDTVIVLSSDHYPYGLKNNEIKEMVNLEDEKIDIHKNHLVIWNNEMEEVIEVNKIAQSLDILPTVLNLFGIEYDSRLLIGNDILSNSDSLVIFNDRSWITEDGKYDAVKNIFTPYKQNISDEYIEDISKVVYNKFVISKNILENNYYNYVLGDN